ncbi:MAG: Na(+)/H(+) antiporter subunit B [Spirochaeta sp.]
MNLEIPFILILCCSVITAFSAVQARGHITAVLLLSSFGILLTVCFALLQAVDVAMAEAVIGTGLMTALFVTTIRKTRTRK